MRQFINMLPSLHVYRAKSFVLLWALMKELNISTNLQQTLNQYLKQHRRPRTCKVFIACAMFGECCDDVYYVTQESKYGSDVISLGGKYSKNNFQCSNYCCCIYLHALHNYITIASGVTSRSKKKQSLHTNERP